MGFADYMVLGIILLVLCCAGFAIYRSKKSGKKCIGCPDSGRCCQNCAGCSGCSIKK